MKKTTLCKLLAMLLLLVMTASCASAETQLEAIQAKGEMVVATEGAWAPWTYHD